MDVVSTLMWPVEVGIPLIFGWAITPLVLSLAIIGYARWRYVRGRRQLDALDKSLAAFGDKLRGFNGDGRAFAEGVEVLRDEYGKDPFIGHAWTGYADDLVFDEQYGRVKSGLPPSEFFNDRLFRQGHINLRSFEATPNQLVGLGLLATFIGLVAALFIARDGIQADLETSKQALRNLLGAAAAKFLTSVAALAASLVFAYSKNRRLHGTEQHIEAINQQLERLVLPLTIERLADDGNRELARQTVQLERFNQDLAVSIAKALDEKIGQTFTTALEPVKQAIEGMAKNIGEVNQSALERMAQQFAGELSGAAQEHTKRLGEMLEKAAESIGELPGQIDAAGERFREAITAGSEELTTSFTAAGENIDATLQQSSVSAGEAIRAVASEIQASGAGIRRELEAAGEGVKDTMAAGVNELSTTMIAAVDNLDAHIEAGSAKLGRSLGAAAERIEASAASLAQVAEESTALATTLNATSDALAKQFEGALQAARDVTSGLTGLIAQVEKAGESAETLGELAETMADTADQLERAAANVGKVADHVEGLNDRSAEIVDGLLGRVDTINRDLGALNNALAAAMQKLFEGLGSFGERTTTFVKSVDKDLADAVGRLSAAVQQLDEVLDDMPKRGDFKSFADAVARGSALRAEAAE